MLSGGCAVAQATDDEMEEYVAKHKISKAVSEALNELCETPCSHLLDVIQRGSSIVVRPPGGSRAAAGLVWRKEGLQARTRH